MILSSEDAKLLKMNELQLAAKCLREGNAPWLASVCDEAAATITRLRSRIAELETSLKPFADEASRWGAWSDGTRVTMHQQGAGCDKCGEDPCCEPCALTVADLRRAALSCHTAACKDSEASASLPTPPGIVPSK